MRTKSKGVYPKEIIRIPHGTISVWNPSKALIVSSTGNASGCLCTNQHLLKSSSSRNPASLVREAMTDSED